VCLELLTRIFCRASLGGVGGKWCMLARRWLRRAGSRELSHNRFLLGIHLHLQSDGLRLGMYEVSL
jgi:hypothetical protein